MARRFSFSTVAAAIAAAVLAGPSLGSLSSAIAQPATSSTGSAVPSITAPSVTRAPNPNPTK